MKRRDFLTTAALGGTTIVGASALGAVDAEAAFAAPTPSLDKAISKTSFAEGRIVAIDGNMLKVAGSHGEFHKLWVTNATSVWKKRDVTIEAAEVGDGLYARGVDMPDGVLAADAIWINIVNLFGTLTDVRSDSVRFRHGSHVLRGRIERGTTVAARLGGSPSYDLSVLSVGRPAQILGAWRPADDSIDVVRVWVGH